MEFVHHCVVCDWQRDASSPTVTSPRCENCGCALASMHASDVPALAGPVQALVLPDGVRRGLVRVAAIAGVVVLMLAAVRTGYTAGGPAMAITAVGVAGLLVVMAMAAEAG